MNKAIYTDKNIKKMGYVSFLIYLLVHLINLIPPHIMKLVIDIYIPNSDKKNIFMGILIFITIPCIFIILQTIFNYISITFCRNKGNELSIAILENIVNQELDFFNKQNSMELVNYSSKEAVNYIYFYISDLPKYNAYIVLSIIVFIIMFKTSPLLAIIQLIFIPLGTFPVKVISKKLKNYIPKVIENNAIINQLRADIIRGIKFVKSMRLETIKINEIKDRNSEIINIWGKVAVLDSLISVWTNGFLTSLFTGLTFGIGAYIVLKGKLSIGSLVSIMSYSAILYSFFNNIFKTEIDKEKQNTEYEKLFSYLNIKEPFNGDIKFIKLKKSISIKSLNFKYNDDKIIFKDCTVDFKKGKWTGIIGKSGEGKSTLLNILLRFYDVNDNTIYFDDLDINSLDKFTIRDNITYISQDIFLFPGSIKDNLILSRKNINEENINEVLDMVNLKEYINNLPDGFNTDIGEAGKLMSGGERQRLALAQGLLRKNDILLLDEVTSNIDKYSENIIKNNIFKLLKDNKTIISISHNIDFLSLVDELYEVKDKKIVKLK